MSAAAEPAGTGRLYRMLALSLFVVLALAIALVWPARSAPPAPPSPEELHPSGSPPLLPDTPPAQH